MRYAVFRVCSFVYGKVKVLYPRMNIGEGAHLPVFGRWARRWINHCVCDAWPLRRHTYCYLTPVPNYTAWWQRHACVNNLPRVALDSAGAGCRTCDLLIASPAHCTTELVSVRASGRTDEPITGCDYYRKLPKCTENLLKLNYRKLHNPNPNSKP